MVDIYSIIIGISLVLIIFLISRIPNYIDKKIKTSLNKRSEQLQSFFNYTTDAINITDTDGRVLYINQAFENMFGWKKDEILGKSLAIIPKNLYPDEKQNRQALLNGKPISNWQAQFVRKDGTYIDVNVTVSPLINSDGEIEGFAGVTRDESKLKLAEKKLREEEEKFRMIAENSSDLIRLIDIGGTIQYASPSHLTVLGVDPSAIIGNHYTNNIHPEDEERVNQFFDDMIHEPQTAIIEYRKKHRDGYYLCMEAHCSPSFDENGNVCHLIAVLRDISERKEYEKKLKELAFYDPLTGVANRRLLQRKLLEAINNSKKENSLFAVLILDCDQFKLVNDTMGHDVGDEMLKEFAVRVKSVIRSTDILCRHGGDEFTLILSEVHSREEITLIAERILRELQKEWSIQGHHFVSTSSIGISVYPTDGEDRHSLLTHADHALYQAKKSGRNSFQYYVPTNTIGPHTH